MWSGISYLSYLREVTLLSVSQLEEKLDRNHNIRRRSSQTRLTFYQSRAAVVISINSNYLEQPKWPIWYQFTKTYSTKHNLKALGDEWGRNPTTENPLLGSVWSKFDKIQREHKKLLDSGRYATDLYSFMKDKAWETAVLCFWKAGILKEG